jgi:hypothetical protein
MVLDAGVIAPDDETILSPAEEEKTPPEEPVTDGIWGVLIDLQKGELEYDILEEGAGVMVTIVVAVTALHPLLAGII